MTPEEAEVLHRHWEKVYPDYLFLQGIVRNRSYSTLLIRRRGIKPYDRVKEVFMEVPTNGLLQEVYPEVWAAHIEEGFGPWLTSAFESFSFIIEQTTKHEIPTSSG